MLDPIRLQVAWSRAISVVDEATAVLIKTAVSTIIRESLDLALVLFDERGRALVQSTICIPSFIGTLPLTMKHFLARYPLEDWRPGDVVATNDPWLGTGQLNDLTLAMPVFEDGALAGFVGVVAHLADVGGTGMAAHASDTYEEGLHVPLCRLYRSGEPDPLVFSFILENVRVPQAVRSDIAAMVAAAETCAAKAVDLLHWLGVRALSELGDDILELSEVGMRKAVAHISPGTYHDEIAIEGFDSDLRIAASIDVGPDAIAVDYSGTSPQVDRAINSTLAHTFAHTAFALKCILNPELPNNEGSFRAITVWAPEASILNSKPPAAGNSRTQVSHYISNLLLRMLGGLAPDRTLAEGGSPRPILTFRGEDREGRIFTNVYQVMAGMGAGAGFDGLSAMAFPTNTHATPVEFMERSVPIRFVEKALRAGSGGEGRWRGGLGQRVVIEVQAEEPIRIMSSPGRTRHTPQGAGGGGRGAAGSLRLNGRDIAWAREAIVARRGDTLEVCSSGGGGNGPAGLRAADLQARDLREELVLQDEHGVTVGEPA